MAQGFNTGAGGGMDFQQLMQMLMQSMNGGGGQNGGQNYFNPAGGNGAYSSNKGMMGAGNPMGGGAPTTPFGSTMSGAGDIASGIYNMFFAQDPSAAGDKYLSGIEGAMGKYLNPYVTAGQQAMPQLQQQYGMLLNDPGAVMNKIGAGFQQSPGYQFQVDQASGAANRAAAAGGMLGSPMQQQNIAGTVNNIANQDYYNYLNHGTNLYEQGLGGMSHIMDNGLNASGQMSQGMLQQLMLQAQNAAMGAANSNSMFGGGIGSIISGLGML